MKKITLILFSLALLNLAQAQQHPAPDSTQTPARDTTTTEIFIPKRYVGIIETGYAWGLGEWGISVYRVNVVNGIKFSFCSVGFGAGFSIPDRSRDLSESIRFDYLVPFYLDTRFFIPDQRITPYLAFGIGLSILHHKMLGDLSLFMNASSGISWKISKDMALIIGIAYESYNIKYDNLPKKYLRYSHALGFNIGISF